MIGDKKECIVIYATAEYGKGRVITVKEIPLDRSIQDIAQLPPLGKGWIYSIELDICGED